MDLKGQVCRVPGQTYFYYTKLKVELRRKEARRRLMYVYIVYVIFFSQKKNGGVGGVTHQERLMKGGPAPSPASKSEMKNSQRNLELKECE